MQNGTTWDVVIVGAGPVGLLTANYLGAQGVKVLVLEQLAQLIDFPRGVGMDDECLRAFQAVGLAERVLPHTTPNQWMRFVTGKGRCFASIEPRTDEFGWPRRNAFIQPLADKVLLEGLVRYPNVTVQFGQTLDGYQQDASGVSVKVLDSQQQAYVVRCQYLVGCDGGRSPVRNLANIAFEGETDSNRWIVIDLRNDPLGTPNAYMHCDPARPYVSIALPHGIRRFEFMLFDGEAQGDTVAPETLREMLAKVVPNPDKVDLIRARVYTHNARLAAQFRDRRVVLAGDAAHIMPVWQGQGYNSGMRDATNLAWKLALVVKGQAEDALLDTYGEERRDHALAMINLSQTAGKIFSPTNPIVVGLRDGLTWLLNYIPPVKRYFLEMRFKPMPRYQSGALFYSNGFDVKSPVGRMFIQPQVTTAEGDMRLDDALGAGFSVLAWGADPAYWLDDASRSILEKMNAKLFSARPNTQFAHEIAAMQATGNSLTILGDKQERLKTWFGQHPESVVILRPDRFVAALCKPQQLPATLQALSKALHLSAAN